MAPDFDEKKVRKILRRFFVASRRIHREGPELIAELDHDTVHHIRTVLRIGPGAKVALYDGSGKEYLAQIIESTPSRVQAKILETREPKTESGLELTLAQALIKEQALDKVLTAATELGVKKIIPVLTKRVVVDLKSKDLDQKMFRWRKILEESVNLSGRILIPQIEYPTQLAKLLDEKFEGTKIVLWEKAQGGELATLEKSRNAKPETINRKPETGNRILLLVGPEGGFEDEEAEAAMAKGFTPLGLGPRILRAETAPIAAISILQYLFGDLS